MLASDETIQRLNALVALDHGAADAYAQAIPRVRSAALRRRLQDFLDDHNRHLLELARLVARLGGQARERGDLTGLLLRALTAIQSMATDDLALRALQTGESLARSRYQAALDLHELPDELLDVVRRHRDDVARHHAWLRQALASRSGGTQPGM
jgi:uncharacterized protein (TIGR02284 family)